MRRPPLRRSARQRGRGGQAPRAPARSPLRRRRRRRPSSGATPAAPRRRGSASAWQSRRRWWAVLRTVRTLPRPLPRRRRRRRNSPPARQRAGAGRAISPRRSSSSKPRSRPRMLLPYPVGTRMLSGDAKPQLLPQFEGEGLGALDKERLPVVAGVEAFADCGERRLGHLLPRAGDGAHLGARCRDLHHLAARRRCRDVDPAGHPGSCGIGGDRGAGIARGILVDRADPDFEQVIDHDRCAAVLERSGRHLRFKLEENRCAVPVALDQRRPAFAERHPRRAPDRQRRGIAPQRGLAGGDFAARQSPSQAPD